MRRDAYARSDVLRLCNMSVKGESGWPKPGLAEEGGQATADRVRLTTERVGRLDFGFMKCVG